MIIYNGKRMAVKVVGSDGSGITPTGTLRLTENGSYDVTALATVVVDVAGYGYPIEVTTATEMKSILENAAESDKGKVYKYIGVTTEDYEHNSYYILEV